MGYEIRSASNFLLMCSVILQPLSVGLAGCICEFAIQQIAEKPQNVALGLPKKHSIYDCFLVCVCLGFFLKNNTKFLAHMVVRIYLEVCGQCLV